MEAGTTNEKRAAMAAQNIGAVGPWSPFGELGGAGISFRGAACRAFTPPITAIDAIFATNLHQALNSYALRFTQFMEIPDDQTLRLSSNWRRQRRHRIDQPGSHVRPEMRTD
ncbi:hypothetical protein D3C78_1679850 [compost metagenome]